MSTLIEQFQLELALEEYRSKGYSVLRKYPTDGLLFDAVARKGDKIVVIELISRKSAEDSAARRRVLSRAAKSIPNAQIDFRMVALEEDLTFPWRTWLALDAGPSIEAIIKQALPKVTKSHQSGSFPFLQLWSLHACTVRSFATLLNVSQEQDLMDVYNTLLERKFLEAPESIEDGVSFDLFQLQVAALAAAQGFATSSALFLQLRKHALSIRQQVRKYLGATKRQ